jgi:hypothetical protein
MIALIGSALAIIAGLMFYLRRLHSEKRKQAEQARKDLDEANAKDDPGSFLDGFGHMR